MSDETPAPHHHHTIRERFDAAEAAADEVVAGEGGQLSGEVDALAVPFEEAASRAYRRAAADRAPTSVVGAYTGPS
jgi:hypothetical protein